MSGGGELPLPVQAWKIKLKNLFTVLTTEKHTDIHGFENFILDKRKV